MVHDHIKLWKNLFRIQQLALNLFELVTTSPTFHLQPVFLNSPATAQPVNSGIWNRIVMLPFSRGLLESEQV
jgi:hypothetical protein